MFSGFDNLKGFDFDKRECGNIYIINSYYV